MKKVFAMMVAMTMAFSVAACGGEEAPTEEAVSMVEMSNEYVSVMIPDDYEEAQDVEGKVVASGSGGSIVIADPAVAGDVTVADITEEIMLLMAGEAYPDVEMLEYENPADVDGTEAVYAKMKGTNANNGLELTMTYFLVFYMVDDVMYEQDICFTYQAGEDTSLEANLNEVIDSITVG